MSREVDLSLADILDVINNICNYDFAIIIHTSLNFIV
ncbi:hypothetical protein Metlim_2252 [Methanoplanus limicola DSM 2279]|uniref:Uncharacterized protein n=1 Tax=Methanoplanus limicola DSM 2279 TaxID=937775 RepID=H1Z1G4_9EURY|nr:hypothetical protein Metlim_2252 [Methanoplanus limicola DSM 2279]